MRRQAEIESIRQEFKQIDAERRKRRGVEGRGPSWCYANSKVRQANTFSFVSIRLKFMSTHRHTRQTQIHSSSERASLCVCVKSGKKIEPEAYNHHWLCANTQAHTHALERRRGREGEGASDKHNNKNACCRCCCRCLCCCYLRQNTNKNNNNIVARWDEASRVEARRNDAKQA